MPESPAETYQCAYCGRAFVDTARTEEERQAEQAEYRKIFPQGRPDRMIRVCERCYDELMVLIRALRN